MSKKRKSRKYIRLPDELIHIPNPDKAFTEKWTEGRNWLNIPSSFRCVMFGPPGTSKTTTCLNILLRADPPFTEIFLWHCDGENTKEYDNLGEDVKRLDSLPPPNDKCWNNENKKLLIIDDIDVKALGKEQMSNLNRVFGYVSTHHNLSVILCVQDCYMIPAICRRCSNLWVLWKNNDYTSMATVARKCGLTAHELKRIFMTVCTGPRDSLWVDMSSGSPAPLRINGYTELIKKKE